MRRITTGADNAQSTLEYAVLVAVVCAAIVGTQVYAKRAVQGRLKSGVDTVGAQFSSKWSNVTRTTTSRSRSRNTLSAGGESVSTLLDHAVTRAAPSLDEFSNRKLTAEALFE